jgi:hypothetical protein
MEGDPSVMSSSNANVPFYPSLVSFSCHRQAKRARGDFLSIILKSPFIPLKL